VLSGQANFTGNNTCQQILAGTSTIQTSTAATAGAFSQTALNFGGISPAIDQGLNNPLVHQWNLGIQREQFGVIWKASYVGTKGNFLLRSRDINFIAAPPTPAASVDDETARLAQWQSVFGLQNGNVARRSNRIDGRYNGIVYVDNSADSNYHAMQFEAQKRVSSSLMLNLNWTWSKDDRRRLRRTRRYSSMTLRAAGSAHQPRHRVAAQFDLRHAWSSAIVGGAAVVPGHQQLGHEEPVGNWGFTGITSIGQASRQPSIGRRRGNHSAHDERGGGQVRPNSRPPLTSIRGPQVQLALLTD